MVKITDPVTLNSWMKTGECVLIDVREVDEYCGGHIQGAINCPLSTFHQDFNLSNFPQRSKIVFQCRSGKRSDTSCQIVEELYPTMDNIYNLEGGILAWIEAGLPVEAQDA